MEQNISDGMCRCCASEGSFKDLHTAYQWMGEEEVYAKMLKDCFDISLSTSELINNGGICEVCITQLRNAFNFKRQVQTTEEQFKKKVHETVFRSNTIKLEVSRGDGDSNHADSDNLSDGDYEVIVKEEKVEDKPKKRQAKATTSKAKKAKNDGETSKRKCVTINHEPVKIEKIEWEGKKDIEIKIVPVRTLPVPQTDLQKHRYNIKEILEGSNATPIRGHKDRGYTCSFCDNEFEKPSDLKKHNIDWHTYNLSTDDIEDLVPSNLPQVCVKLDITDLTCNSCNGRIDSVEDLCDHLQNAHDKTIFNDIMHQILPFKFNEQILQCHICNNIYNKFKKLMEHMNVHYSNYICDICEAGFVNKRKLHYHKVGHNNGNYKCDMCPKHFHTYGSKKYHERRYHDKNRLFNKCGYCNALFKGMREKDLHLAKEHGVTSFQRKCQACDKIFSHQNALHTHMRRYHLVERKHKCPECDKTFFSTSDVKVHMVKHTGQKEYKCEICLKSYARKWTLSEHLRIHSDDRRYKCEHCGQTFVQKCSWRAHMRSRHGEKV